MKYEQVKMFEHWYVVHYYAIDYDIPALATIVAGDRDEAVHKCYEWAKMKHFRISDVYVVRELNNDEQIEMANQEVNSVIL